MTNSSHSLKVTEVTYRARLLLFWPTQHKTFELCFAHYPWILLFTVNSAMVARSTFRFVFADEVSVSKIGISLAVIAFFSDNVWCYPSIAVQYVHKAETF